MNIRYMDEYNNDLYHSSASIMPVVGDTVILDDEEYRIKHRIFYPERDIVVVIITQNVIRSSHIEDASNSRLDKMNNAILDINKRQDIAEKKNRGLTEQLSVFRKNINKRNQQDKKDHDETR